MDYGLFFTYLAACAAAATTGAMFKPGDWYSSLEKPSWTPPGWVFPMVWTSIYILMSLAAMRVAMLAGTGPALAFWSVQIAFNTLWSPVFFGLHRLGAALVILCCLWLAVAATMLAFWAVDQVAGAMMVPYLVWVTIAGALNATVWRMNPAP